MDNVCIRRRKRIVAVWRVAGGEDGVACVEWGVFAVILGEIHICPYCHHHVLPYVCKPQWWECPNCANVWRDDEREGGGYEIAG